MRKIQFILFFLLASIFMQCASEAPEKFALKDKNYFAYVEKKADSYAFTILVSWDFVFEQVEVTAEEKEQIATSELAMFMTVGQLDEQIKLIKLEQTHGFNPTLDEKIVGFLTSAKSMENLNQKLKAVIDESGIKLNGTLVSCLVAVSDIEEKP